MESVERSGINDIGVEVDGNDVGHEEDMSPDSPEPLHHERVGRHQCVGNLQVTHTPPHTYARVHPLHPTPH